jgi:hypothetical protein
MRLVDASQMGFSSLRPARLLLIHLNDSKTAEAAKFDQPRRVSLSGAVAMKKAVVGNGKSRCPWVLIWSLLAPIIDSAVRSFPGIEFFVSLPKLEPR